MAATATQMTAEGTKRPILGLNKAAAQERKTAIQNPAAQEEGKVQEPVLASDKEWLDSLEDASSEWKHALLVELATGLSFYTAKSEGVNLDDKKQASALKNGLREVYVKAGYKAESARGENSEDYKSCWRKCDAAFAFFKWLGGREHIIDLVAEARPRFQIKVIAEYLEQFNLNGVNAIFEKAGKPVAKKKAKEDDTQGKQESAKDEDKPKATLSAEAASIPQQAAQQQGDDVGTQPQQGSAEAPEQDADAAAMKAMDKHYSAPSGTQNRRAADRLPPGRILKTDNLVVAIPFNVSYGEVLQMAQALVDFAQQQLSPAGNVAPAMH